MLDWNDFPSLHVHRAEDCGIAVLFRFLRQPMGEHIDVDTSGLLQRDINMDAAGDVLLDMLLRTANGRLTAAEALGHREFVLTRLYESA